jgi:hypothetical protein
VAGNVIRDLAALNKFEMLPWDLWGAQPGMDERLSPQQMKYFDDLADLTRSPHLTFDCLRQSFDHDPGLRIPNTVYNALLHQTQQV